MFVNVLSAMFRGTMDKIDNEPTADRHRIQGNQFSR
jgi:hypothetical protein